MAAEAQVRRVRSWLAQLALADRAALGARLTCLTLLFAPVRDWYLRPLVLVLSAAGLLFDDRFEDFVVLLTSLSYEQIDTARDYLEADYRGDSPEAGLPWSLLLLARAATLWNLLDQALVAAAFLAPPASCLGRMRDPLLILFCFVTYAVAPVASFGWLLLAMGMAQSEPQGGSRIGYLAAFAVLAFYSEVPWAGLLVDVFGLE